MNPTTIRFLLVLGSISLFSSSCDSPTNKSQALPNIEAIIGDRGRGEGQFTLPRALAYNSETGHLCIVDRSGRIQRFLDLNHPAADVNSEIVQKAKKDFPEYEGWQLINYWTLPEFEIGYPTRLHINEKGELLVSDTHYHRVRRYDPTTGTLLESWGETGEGEGQFSQVRDVMWDSAGNYYVGDYGGVSDRILKFSPDKKLIKTIGKRGSGPVEFQRIQAIEIHYTAKGEETLLVVDSCNHRIQRLTLEGEFIEEWGSEGDALGQFRYPFALAIEPGHGGDIYVVEWGNNRVQRFTGQGKSLGVFGEPGRKPGQLATPWDIELASDGRFFLADCNNHRVQVFRWPKTGT